MSTATMVTPLQAPAANVPFDVTIELFTQMVESGLIPRDRRVFLWNGRLYEKMAKTKAHGYVGAAFVRGVNRRLPDGWSLWPESTMVLDALNAPLPDFMVVRIANPLDFAALDRYPIPADIGMVIEVSVTSLRDDLTTALEQYARASIPAFWVLDVLRRRIMVHSEPRVVDGRGEFGRVETYGPGQSLPLVLDGQEVSRIPFDELLR